MAYKGSGGKARKQQGLAKTIQNLGAPKGVPKRDSKKQTKKTHHKGMGQSGQQQHR